MTYTIILLGLIMLSSSIPILQSFKNIKIVLWFFGAINVLGVLFIVYGVITQLMTLIT